MDWKIPLSDIDFGPEESSAVQQVLDSRWLTMGGVTQKFEEEFAAYVGIKHAVAVANCTAALHLACIALGLKPGDEVVVPSLTFVATANAVRQAGAKPVFADIDGPQNLCITADTIERSISERTRLIIVMHYGGYACDMAGILDLAQRRGIRVVEDAAHAVGSELRGRSLGTWGDIGCYSFFSNKNLTTGEGGMLVTADDDLAGQFRILRSHGMTAMTWDRHQGHAWTYDVVAPGFNYRIDEIHAALGRVQLGKLDRNNERRKTLTLHYRNLLQELAPAIGIPFQDHPGNSACHIMPVLLPYDCDRTRFMEQMKAQGIQTSIHYPPIHKFKAYVESGISSEDLPVTEDIASREVTLPLYPTMTENHVESVAQAVRLALRESCG